MLAADSFRLEFKEYLANKIVAAREDLATFESTGDEHFAGRPNDGKSIIWDWWLNEMNDWTWHHVYGAEAAMEEMAGAWANDPDPRLGDLLKQCGRSLFLLEASDWQFLISTFSARDYAELRLTLHNDDFLRLAAMTRRYAAERELPAEDWNFFQACRERDDLFPDLDPRWWARLQYPPVETE